MVKLNNIVKNIFYINLDKRIDRKNHIENQLKVLNLTANRFPAIYHKFGALGCSLSHLTLLKYAKRENLEYIIIMEDDVIFTNPSIFLTSLDKFLNDNINFDVLLLAGNNMGNYEKITDYYVKVTHCQTTTAYLVKHHYYDTLIDNFQNGINLLINQPNKIVDYAIDQYWKKLQKKDNWFLLIPLSVAQKPDISDVEKRPTNYIKAMLDLDKFEFRKFQLTL